MFNLSLNPLQLLPSRRKVAALRRRAAWQAAQANRLTADWLFSGGSSSDDVKGDWTTIVGRARTHARDNAYAKKYLDMVVKNVVGDRGIQLNVLPKDSNGTIDTAAAKLIEDAWKRWGENPLYVDMAGRKTWLDSQQASARRTARDGETLVRMVKGADNPFGFAIKFYDCRVLDIDFNLHQSGQNQIIMGIEVDTWGRPVAYHLKQTTSNSVSDDSRTGRHVRIPADEIIHWGVEEYEDQIRYMSWMATAMVQAQHLGNYEQAEIIASRQAASKIGFFTQKTGDNWEPDSTDDDGKYFQHIEPGKVPLLPRGWDYKDADATHPTTAYAEAVKGFKRAVATAYGVAYHTLGNDLEGVNLSSIRHGLQDERDMWKVIQEQMAQHFCRPIFRNWLRMALLTQAVPLPISKMGKFMADNWLGRRWPFVDPFKDAKANEILVDRLWRTNTSVAGEIGGNYADNIEIANAEPTPPQPPATDTGSNTNGQN